MRKVLCLFMLLIIAAPAFATEEDIYYARCNIRALDGEISWNNWLATKVEIPAGARVTAKEGNQKIYNAAENKFEERRGVIILMGGREYYVNLIEPLEKYLQKEPLDMSSLKPEISEAIKTVDPIIGMTKEQVIMSLCFPAYVAKSHSRLKGLLGIGQTESMSTREIIDKDIWLYQHKKMGRKFIVEFDKNGVATSMTWGVQ